MILSKQAVFISRLIQLSKKKGMVTINQQKDYMEIDLMRLLKAMWHKAWMIAVCTVIGAVIAFTYVTLAITPLYQARVLMYVNNNAVSLGSASVSLSAGDITLAKNLVSTYSVILKTRMTLEEVIERANLDYSYEQLVNMVSASSVNNTEVFQIVVTSPSPEEAKLIANTIAEVLPDKIANIILDKSAKVVDYAVTPRSKASPSVTKYTVIGGLLGFIICCGIIVVYELNDTLIHSEDYLLQTYNIPVLAAIPDIADVPGSKGYYGGYGYGSSGGRA